MYALLLLQSTKAQGGEEEEFWIKNKKFQVRKYFDNFYGAARARVSVDRCLVWADIVGATIVRADSFKHAT